MTEKFIEKIKENNFKQGTCLLIKDDSKIKTRENNFLKPGLYVVTSQDCDIINPDLVKEPYIDLLFVQKLSEHNGSYTQGKNPRRLHLTTNGHSNHHLELIIHDHYKIAKENLKALTPHNNTTIEGKNLQILVDWLIKRISRAAFPDEFNKRIGKSRKKLEKILASDAKNTKGLFIKLNTFSELPANEPYMLEVYILVDPEYYKNNTSNTTIDDALEKIIDILINIKGIKVEDKYKVRSTDEISVYEFQGLKQWDFDYISFND